MGNLGGPFEVIPGEPAPVGDCRVCVRPTWRSDDVGPVHACCSIHGSPCLACSASLGQQREQERRRG